MENFAVKSYKESIMSASSMYVSNHWRLGFLKYTRMTVIVSLVQQGVRIIGAF